MKTYYFVYCLLLFLSLGCKQYQPKSQNIPGKAKRIIPVKNYCNSSVKTFDAYVSFYKPVAVIDSFSVSEQKIKHISKYDGSGGNYVFFINSDKSVHRQPCQDCFEVYNPHKKYPEMSIGFRFYSSSCISNDSEIEMEYDIAKIEHSHLDLNQSLSFVKMYYFNNILFLDRREVYPKVKIFQEYLYTKFRNESISVSLALKYHKLSDIVRLLALKDSIFNSIIIDTVSRAVN